MKTVNFQLNNILPIDAVTMICSYEYALSGALMESDITKKMREAIATTKKEVIAIVGKQEFNKMHQSLSVLEHEPLPNKQLLN